MFLKEKLRNTQMQKGKGITPFLTRLKDIRDELVQLGLRYIVRQNDDAYSISYQYDSSF